MSKIARLASIVERAEKQALVLFIDESKQNDSTALAMLKKRGVPEPEKVLELLKEITVDGTENGKTVWDISKTGKEIQPLAGWFCSTWNNDDLVQARERVADTVHKMYQIPSARNQELTKVWLANRDLAAFEAWLTKMYEKDKAKGNIVDAEKGEVVDVRAYEFPKKMLAYSDDKVDCYRANTPAEAMLLGNGYSFCISRKDGSNMFYSYRMNPTTTAYFCWFKDKNGNKTKSNMCVLHVGEDGKYMATPSQNGQAPRESAQNVIEKYPGLEGAIESGKLTVIPMSDMEKEVRGNYNPRSTVYLEEVKGKSPEYIELILSQGSRLDYDAFVYIFEKVDKGDLKRGNNGNSLIKKYVESGIHRLSVDQEQVLIDSGYENEVARAVKVWWRGMLEAGRSPDMSDEDFKLLLKYGDLDSDDSVILSYVAENGLDDEEKLDIIKGLGGGYSDKIRVANAQYVVNRKFTVVRDSKKPQCVLEDGKMVLRGDGKNRVVIDDESIISLFDVIENIYLFGFYYVNITEAGQHKGNFPEFRNVNTITFDGCEDVDFSYLRGDSFNTIVLEDSKIKGDTLSAVSVVKLELVGEVTTDGDGLVFPKGIKDVKIEQSVFSGGEVGLLGGVDWPKKLENLTIDYKLEYDDFLGFPDEITGKLALDLSSISYKESLTFKNFPKKVHKLLIQTSRLGKLPKSVLKCDVGSLVIVGGSNFGEKTLERFGGYLPSIKDKETLSWITSHTEVAKLSDTYGFKVEDDGDSYIIMSSVTYCYINKIPDKPIKEFTFSTKEYSLNTSITLNTVVTLDAVPYKVQSKVPLYVRLNRIWRKELSLNHKVEGVKFLEIVYNDVLEKVSGLKNFVGLKRVNIIESPSVDVDYIKEQLPGVSVVVEVKESLSLSPLSVVLNSIIG